MLEYAKIIVATLENGVYVIKETACSFQLYFSALLLLLLYCYCSDNCVFYDFYRLVEIGDWSGDSIDYNDQLNLQKKEVCVVVTSCMDCMGIECN